MARGSPQASGAAGQANANSNAFNANASQLYGDLTPTLESEVANPQGFSPTDEAALETGAQQSAAGQAAGATGAGRLAAARTRNQGAFGKSISDATRGAGENLSKNLLGIRTANAGLKNSQRQAGIGGLENLTGLETGATNTALGEVAPAVQANNAAIGQSWDWANDILDPALAAGGAVGAAKVCWIAEVIYGVDDPRTHLVRAWLTGPFLFRWYGRLVMAVYAAIGQRVAAVARRSWWLRAALKPLFDAALRKAVAW